MTKNRSADLSNEFGEWICGRYEDAGEIDIVAGTLNPHCRELVS